MVTLFININCPLIHGNSRIWTLFVWTNNSSSEDEASEGEEPRRGNQIQRGAIVTFAQIEKGNKKGNVYVQASRSMKLWKEFQVNIFYSRDIKKS